MLGSAIETLLPFSFSYPALPCFPHGAACAQPIPVSLGKEKAKESAEELAAATANNPKKDVNGRERWQKGHHISNAVVFYDHLVYIFDKKKVDSPHLVKSSLWNFSQAVAARARVRG